MEKTDSIYVIEDLVSVAQHNEQEFIVESIITHCGSRNRRSTLEFQVR
jgi:hypothetical protein